MAFSVSSRNICKRETRLVVGVGVYNIVSAMA
jgi:hypothetical protein